MVPQEEAFVFRAVCVSAKVLDFSGRRQKGLGIILAIDDYGALKKRLMPTARRQQLKIMAHDFEKAVEGLLAQVREYPSGKLKPIVNKYQEEEMK